MAVTDISSISFGSNTFNLKDTSKYEKPAGGIPYSDLENSVKTSLGKADSALQEHQSLSVYRTSAAQDIIDAGKLSASSKGIAGGVAELDANGKVPVTQCPIEEDVAQATTDWLNEHIAQETGYVLDDTLSVSGAAADAKKTGDEIGDLKSALSQIVPGLSEAAKAALLNCFRHVAFLDNDEEYYSALENALYGSGYPKLEALFSPGDRTFYTDEDVSALVDYLTVRYYQDSEHSAKTIVYDNYSISGSLSQSTNTITVRYNGISASIPVNAVVLRNITADDISSHVGYNDISVSNGTVEPTTVETFAILAYVDSLIRFSMPLDKTRYVYRKSGDNFYATDGTTHFLFTKDGSKYTATNVTSTETANIEKVGNPYDSSKRMTAVLDTETNVLKIGSDDSNYILFRNANTIGYWGANNQAGIEYKLTNVMTINN